MKRNPHIRKIKIGRYELSPKNILTNDFTLPDRRPYKRSGFWIIGNEYGPLVALWANHEQDALDIGVDEGKLNSFLMSPEDAEEYEREGWNIAYIGNASEPANLDYAWIEEVPFNKMSRALLKALENAYEQGKEHL